jgi:hypothetical protein
MCFGIGWTLLSQEGASLLGAVGVAEVIDDDVECGEEGVHIEHGLVPFPTGLGGKPTLRRGHLPLKSLPPNSHQAFNGAVAVARCLSSQAISF